MNNQPATPEGKERKNRHIAEAASKLHADPVWRAKWLEGIRAHQMKRKELLERAFEALAKQESPK